MESETTLLQALLRQEELLQFAEFTNDTAFELGIQMVEAARKEEKSLTVDIRRNGQQLFHCALAGTAADNDAWIRRKIRVVNRFGHSSFYVGRSFVSRGTTIRESALLDETHYAPHGGAFPIIIRQVGIVGTITVSGLPQQEDHEFVVRMIAAYLGITLDV